MVLCFFVELSCANNKEWIVDVQPTVHQQWSPLSSLITLLDLSLGKTVYSILLQSTQLQNEYLA